MKNKSQTQAWQERFDKKGFFVKVYYDDELRRRLESK